MSKFNVGDKVRYIGKDHREMPEFYPKIGTIGTVMKEGGDTDWYIQWPKGSTSGKDCWYCDENDIELVIEDMTNEEIWGMLQPKIEKNGLTSIASISHFSASDYSNGLASCKFIPAYAEKDVHNAIAIAYRSGYKRAMKGRPFKFGEKKKQGGHWVPVDIKDVLKGECKIVEDCLGWHYEYLGTYKKGEDGKFYQWVEDNE